jgi:hypothetical protein
MSSKSKDNQKEDHSIVNENFSNDGIQHYGFRHFQPDEATADCFLCNTSFSFFTRRHHCRACRRLVCDGCSQQSVRVGSKKKAKKCRLCERCVHVIKLPVSFEKEEETANA